MRRESTVYPRANEPNGRSWRSSMSSLRRGLQWSGLVLAGCWAIRLSPVIYPISRSVWCCWRKSARNQGAQAGLAAREGWLLLTGNLLALALVEISVVYMLVAEFTQRADLNPTTGSLAVRVVLGFCPELLAAIVLVFAGFVTRGAGEVGAGEAGLGYGQGRRHRHAHGHGRRSSPKHGTRSLSRSH